MAAAGRRNGTSRRLMAPRASWAAVIALGFRVVRCWRCGCVLHEGNDWDLGHRTDKALGGADSPENLWPEHRSCNRQAGGALGLVMRRNGGHVYPPPSREW